MNGDGLIRSETLTMEFLQKPDFIGNRYLVWRSVMLDPKHSYETLNN